MAEGIVEVKLAPAVEGDTPMTDGRVAARGVRILTVLAWLWLAVALPFLTDAGCDMFVALGLAASWAVLGIIWLVLLPVGWRTGWAWLLSAGVAGCLGLVFGLTNLGLVLRVALSESSLAGYAAEVQPDFLHPPQRVGLFLVDGESTYDGIVFLYTSQGFLNREGLAYVPPGTELPAQIPRHHLRHLYGPWYWACWRF
jgi:hypothetical protein